MEHTPMPQEIYRHFKGNTYQIITVAEHSETGEKLVIYQALYGDYKIYARPLSMFMEKVDRSKYPDASQEYRFELAATVMNKEEKPAGAGTVIEKNATDEMSGEGEVQIDPMVLEFLDAGSYEERLNILAGIHHRITDDMINVMAIATDIEVKPGDVETRYMELRNCLLKLEKFECNRLR